MGLLLLRTTLRGQDQYHLACTHPSTNKPITNSSITIKPRHQPISPLMDMGLLLLRTTLRGQDQYHLTCTHLRTNKPITNSPPKVIQIINIPLLLDIRTLLVIINRRCTALKLSYHLTST
jgi:hypothetical protein